MSDNVIDRLISDCELKQKQIAIDLYQNDRRLADATDPSKVTTLNTEGLILREQLRMTQTFLNKLHAYK